MPQSKMPCLYSQMNSRFGSVQKTMTGTVLLYESRRRAFLSKGLFGLKFFLNCFWQPMLS